jgi:hypothetical protein
MRGVGFGQRPFLSSRLAHAASRLQAQARLPQQPRPLMIRPTLRFGVVQASCGPPEGLRKPPPDWPK